MLVCEAERAFEDTRNSRIIIGVPTEYSFDYQEHAFKFRSEELITDEVFNKCCLAKGLHIVDFGEIGWRAYVNEIQKKAVICDETDYEPYVSAAKEFCLLLLNSGIDKADSDSSLVERRGTYYHAVEMLKVLVLDSKPQIAFDLLQRVLEKHGVKRLWEFGEDHARIDGEYVEVWNFNKKEMQEFVGWKT